MKILRSCLVGLAALAAISPAIAGEMIEVEVDKSRMITIAATPGAVVIGNPSIADVTTHGDKIFIHGRNFGETNLIVLDVSGNTIAEYNLVTRHVNDGALSIYKAATFRPAFRNSYTCHPLCESDMQVGDDYQWFKEKVLAASLKTEFATGSETSEAKAPVAPQ